MDTHLIDRREDERWPLQPTVTSLLNAPVLQRWGPSELTALLDSKVIRRNSDDDLSLVLVRRIEPAGTDARQADGLTLTPTEEVRPGCPTWLVAGCASLLAVASDLDLPADRGVAPRQGQVWDRGRRHGPVNWPVGRLDGDLVLVQRLPPGAVLVADALRGAGPMERAEALDGVRASVAALDAAGLSHGRLSAASFALYPDATVVLWEPGPGMFEGVDQEALASLDRAFVSDLGAADPTAPAAVDPPPAGGEA